MMSTTDFTHEQELQNPNEAPAPQKDDFERLLEFAEELQKKLYKERQEIRGVRIARVCSVILGLMLVAAQGLKASTNVLHTQDTIYFYNASWHNSFHVCCY